MLKCVTALPRSTLCTLAAVVAVTAACGGSEFSGASTSGGSGGGGESGTGGASASGGGGAGGVGIGGQAGSSAGGRAAGGAATGGRADGTGGSSVSADAGHMDATAVREVAGHIITSDAPTVFGMCTIGGTECPTGYQCGCGGPGVGVCECHKNCQSDAECSAPNAMCGCSANDTVKICVSLCFCTCGG